MSETIKTQVVSTKCKWGREGYLEIVGNEVIFDTSDDEYGPVFIDLQLLEDKIKEHKEKLE